MNKSYLKIITLSLFIFSMISVFSSTTDAQNFDFERLKKKTSDYTVIIDMTIEVTFGMNSSTEREKFLGTIVTEDGLVLFNGIILDNQSGLGMHGFSLKTEPGEIKIKTLDGRTFDGEFIGVNEYSKFGFIRILSDERFNPVVFKENESFRVGSWLSLFLLLPDFIDPPLAADVGMVSSIIISPESIPLTIGFNNLELASVLYNEKLEPVGLLGRITDRSSNQEDQFNGNVREFGLPLLGVMTADRLKKMIESPPSKGNGDRGWLGISLQAFTQDLADFWSVETTGGIIVNEVMPNSPAEKGGLKVGDIIFEVNGLTVDVDREEKLPIFQRTIAELGPGTTLELKALRPSDNTIDTAQLEIILAKAPIAAIDAPEYENKRFEFSVRSMVFSDYIFYKLDESSFNGVRISKLKQGGLADIAGLNIGDIVQRIDNEDVYSIDDVKRIMSIFEESKPKEIIFFIWRNYKTMFINVKTDW